MLRTIHGPTQENGISLIRKNKELREQVLVTTAKIGWRSRGAERLYDGHPGGERPRGRPRIKWFQDMGEGEWKQGNKDVKFRDACQQILQTKIVESMEGHST